MSNKLQWVNVDGVTMLRKGNELFANLDEYLLAIDSEVKELENTKTVKYEKQRKADEMPDVIRDIAAMDDLMGRILSGKDIHGFFM